jgi:hypothetical protein
MEVLDFPDFVILLAPGRLPCPSRPEDRSLERPDTGSSTGPTRVQYAGTKRPREFQDLALFEQAGDIPHFSIEEEVPRYRREFAAPLIP